MRTQSRRTNAGAHPSSFIIQPFVRQLLPIRGRYDSLLPAFGCDHLLENALLLLCIKSALGEGRFGLTNFALLMSLVKLADDAPQASRAVQDRFGRFVMGPIVEFDQDVL